MTPRTYKLLLVADDPTDAASLRDELSRLDNGARFEITHTRQLNDAVQQTQSENYHLMLVDLKLPGHKGISSFKNAQTSVPSVPIVVLSDEDGRKTAVRALKEGAQDFIIKGQWDGDAVARSLAHAVERRELLSGLHKSQEALQEIEQRFQAVFNTVPDLIYIKDEDLRITHVNPAMKELFGMEESELIGSRAEDLYGKKAAEAIEKWDLRALDGESVQQEHTREVNGVTHTFLDLRVPLPDAEGEIIGVCCVSRDITEWTRAVRPAVGPEIPYPSEAMQGVLKQARKIAGTDGLVLLLGESGSGKDYLAKWIHDHSARSDSPYFSVNCAALTPELAESELFGHESGSFTGARGRKRGMLELAEGGSLLLNEVGELPLQLQSKLLTFLDTRSFLRVGGERSITVDARLLAATHRNLEEEVAAGRFLEPLYHRLNVFALHVPCLKDRAEDIPILAEEMIDQLAKNMQMTEVPIVSQSALQGLKAYNWPGNVRELRNVIERALMLWEGGPIDLKLPAPTREQDMWSYDLPFPSYWSLREVLDEIIKSMCMQALRRAKGNKKEAAKLLGTSRDALYRYIRRYEIDPKLLT